MLYHKYKPLASRVYCTGLALLLVLSEVFSSNVQDTLPGFSRIMRLGLTGCAVLLLAGKIILLTGPRSTSTVSASTASTVCRTMIRCGSARLRSGWCCEINGSLPGTATFFCDQKKVAKKSPAVADAADPALGAARP